MDDIDMQSYSGATDLAAVDQQQPNTPNAYEAHEDFPVYEEFLVKETQEQTPAASEPQSAPVPSEQELNFKALREEIDRIKAERDSERQEYRQNLEMMRNNAPQKPAPVEDRRMFGEMDDNDVPTAGDIRKAWENRESQYQARIEELEISRQYPDYADVLTKYTAPLLKQKPHLAEGLRSASNKALFAYELGVMARGIQPQPAAPVVQQPPANQRKAERIIENSRKPGNLSSFGGGQSTLSKADYYGSMSDKDFLALAAKNLGEI